TYTVTDAHGNTTTGTILVDIVDDVPTLITPDRAVLVNAVGSTATFVLDTDANIDNNVGADQLGSISFADIVNGQQATGVINGSTVNLTSGGQPILLYLVDHDSNPATPMQLQGWTGGLGTGTEIFQITLQPDGSLASSTDQYQVQVFAAIGATQQTHIDNFSALGSNTQQFKALDVAGTTQDVLFSGYERAANGTSNAASGSSVSASTIGIGVANNSMNDGDNLRIDFVNDATVSSGNNNSYNYSTHYNVNSFQFSIVQVNGSPPADSIETWVRIYNAGDDPNTANDSAALANDAQLNTITDIKVNGVSLNLASLTTDGSGGYLVTGLDLHDTVLVTASGTGYDRIEIENARSINGATPSLDGESFDIGAFAFVTTSTNVPSVELNFDLLLKDADGDTSKSSLIVDLLSSGSATSDHSSSGSGVTETAAAGVTNIIGSDFSDSLTGNGSDNVLAGMNGNDTLHGAGGNDLLIGGLGDDALYGDGGNDILIGGAGHNTLNGGSGVDTFKIDHLDIKDLITDYSGVGGDGDKIDLTALFQTGGASVTDFVKYDAGTGALSVDTDGTGNGATFVEVAELTPHPAAHTINILYDDGIHAQPQTTTV
ncbi:type I secretion C-terminal target domain-containing protein, partial [Mesorhizobium sp.]|uniref:calcium-binding protein n=1 Tax=Mesorhizobium sp. TaxID=1871066 RepID=UPI0025F65B0B